MLKNQGDVVALYDQEIRLVARKPAAPEQLGKKLTGTYFESVLANGQAAADYQAVSPLDGVELPFALRKVEGLPLSILVGRSEPDSSPASGRCVEWGVGLLPWSSWVA